MSSFLPRTAPGFYPYDPTGAGRSVLSGTGAPPAYLGLDGDFYYDPENTTMYGPKVGGVWPEGVNLSVTVTDFTPPGPGAVIRNIQDKLRETVSVKDFGAVGDGVADDTAAIQLALNTGKGVTFPHGQYRISDFLSVSVAGTRILGDGITGTRILQGTLNKAIFNVTANDVTITGFSLDFDGTPVAGATAIDCTGDNPDFRAIKINRCHQGIKCTGVIIGFLSDLRIYNYVSAGLYFDGSADCFISNFMIDALSSTNGVLGGIYIANFGEALCFSNGDILNGAYSILTAATVDTPGSVPAHNSFIGVYFDGAVNGCFLDKFYNTEFVNCWFSGGRSGSGNPGCNLGKAHSVSFTNCRFVGCGSHGCLVSSTARYITFTGCHFLGNSQTAGANVASGLLLSNGTSDIAVTNCFATNTYFIGVQQYGIAISANCTRVSCRGNIVAGNGTAGMFVGTNLTACRVEANIGYNPVGASAITVGASPYTYTAGPSPETVYISAGTVSSVVAQGTAVFTSTNVTIQLGPGETVQVTYSALPTMKKVIH